ncbi:MAG: D-alanine--D-alanine ligase [Gammaproteobacteria bacterium]|nr:D-alanine--D-alanine ligase [Gammaproteobacteria bacterium]
MGGCSAEREISLQSGKAVLEALVSVGVDAVGVDGKDLDCNDLRDYDRVFIALHGRGGEDGSIQGALEHLGIPYTGSAVLASALAMDKIRCKQLWTGIGLSTPKFYTPSNEAQLVNVVDEAGFPFIVKPCREGSSIGMEKVQSGLPELANAFRNAQQYDEVLIEQYIDGAEYTVTIVGQEILPPIRLETPRTFYDYKAKYFSNDTQYHCPCGLQGDKLVELEQLAKWAFDSLGCQGWGRVDLMMGADQEFYVLEVNTVPGMTSHSLVPMSAKQAGIEFSELVVRILKETLV